jgi:hypothetical protein
MTNLVKSYLNSVFGGIGEIQLYSGVDYAHPRNTNPPVRLRKQPREMCRNIPVSVLNTHSIAACQVFFDCCTKKTFASPVLMKKPRGLNGLYTAQLSDHEMFTVGLGMANRWYC